jgi:hypothetical protein
VALESRDGKFIYHTKHRDMSSLYQAPAGGGEETKVLEAVTFLDFAAAEGGIYFIPAADESGRSSIYFLELATGKTTPVARIDKPVSVGLTVSPDGCSILYSQIDQQGSDLMLVENFR